MTEKQKEQREQAIGRAYGVCYVCKKPLAGTAVQYAHRIANTKTNRSKYGSFIIDHTLNGEMVCSLKCNQSLNIGFDKGKCLDLIATIVIAEIKKFSGEKNYENHPVQKTWMQQNGGTGEELLF